jgi:SAM-dependent methyltransferase
MDSSELSEHALTNRAVWTEYAARYAERAPARWATDEITWGIWDVPEVEVSALPDVAGKDVVELGCGTAYFSAWVARRGARPVGVDVTPAQLATARAMQEEHGLEFPLIEASAEDVPLPDASFDLAISEYGASIWCDPARWLAEASRLLRPGGELVFLRNSTLVMLCSPDVGQAEERLHRAQRDLYRLAWPGEGEGIEFHPPHGELIRLLHANGFEIVDLIELYAGDEHPRNDRYDYVTLEWSQRWPAEEIWRARKRV